MNLETLGSPFAPETAVPRGAHPPGWLPRRSLLSARYYRAARSQPRPEPRPSLTQPRPGLAPESRPSTAQPRPGRTQPISRRLPARCMVAKGTHSSPGPSGRIPGRGKARDTSVEIGDEMLTLLPVFGARILAYCRSGRPWGRTCQFLI